MNLSQEKIEREAPRLFTVGQRGWRPGRRFWCGLAIAVAAFALQFWLARTLDARGAFSQGNTLFDADASSFLSGFADGSSGFTSWGGNCVVHPNANNFINLPLRVAARTIHLLSFGSMNLHALRHQMALMVAPAATALKLTVIYATLLLLDLPLPGALLLTALGLVSFCSLLFGAVPESYPLSSALLAILFCALVIYDRRRQTRPALPWFVIGLLLCGITLTNLGPFFIALGLLQFRWQTPLPRILRDNARMWAAIILLTFGLSFGLGALYSLKKVLIVNSPGQFEEIANRVLPTLHRFPLASSQMFLPSRPVIQENTTVPATAPKKMLFTYRTEPVSTWRVALTALLIGGGIVGACRTQSPTRRLVYGASGLVILFNWVLHSFFGLEIFLYTQHWSVPLLLLTVGWFDLPGRRFGWMAPWGILTAMAIVCGLNSMMVLRHILAVLGG